MKVYRKLIAAKIVVVRTENAVPHHDVAGFDHDEPPRLETTQLISWASASLTTVDPSPQNMNRSSKPTTQSTRSPNQH